MPGWMAPRHRAAAIPDCTVSHLHAVPTTGQGEQIGKSDHIDTHHLPRWCGASHIDTFWMDSPFSQELQLWVLHRLDTSRHPTVDFDGHLFAFFLKKYLGRFPTTPWIFTFPVLILHMPRLGKMRGFFFSVRCTQRFHVFLGTEESSTVEVPRTHLWVGGVCCSQSHCDSA